MTERLDPKDIAPEQYAAWRNHPVTLFMFQYMRDFAEGIEHNMLLKWRVGAVQLVNEHEGRGRVATLTEIPDIKWETILEFYGIEPKPTEDENKEDRPDE